MGMLLLGAQLTGWQQLPIGAGGQIVNIDIAADGTKVCSADQGGAFVWDDSQIPNRWRQLITSQTMPSGYLQTPGTVVNSKTILSWRGGVWATNIAYNNSNIIYLLNRIGDLLRSTDKGRTFVKLSNFTRITDSSYDVNYALKFYQQKMAVDPANPDILYIAAQDGIRVSFNATQASPTFAVVSTGSVPAPLAGSCTAGTISGTSFTLGGTITGTYAVGQWLVPFGTWGETRITAVTGNGQTAGNVCTLTANLGTISARTIAAQSWSSGIAFDSSGGTTTVSGQTRTAILYLPSFGNGLYRSSDGGQTWAQVANGTSSPLQITSLQIDPAGVLFCNDGATGIWKGVWGGASMTWTNILTSANMPAGTAQYGQVDIATDPRTSGRVVLYQSGVWTINEYQSGSWITSSGAPWQNVGRTAVTTPSDVPWLAAAGPTKYTTLGCARFDGSTNPSTLYVADGIGVFKGPFPTTSSSLNPWTVTYQSYGIEQLVCLDGVAINTLPIVGCLDRAAFAPNTVGYPTAYGPENSVFGCGWGIDKAANGDNFVACRTYTFTPTGDSPRDASGYSTDGGQTWTRFSAQCGGGLTGAIACASSQNIVVLAGSVVSPGIYYTLDRGATWTIAPGLPTTNYTHGSFSQLGRIVAADQVNYNSGGTGIGTFYVYSPGDTTLYRTTDGGVSWTARTTTFSPAFKGFNSRLRAAPANAGHLWYTSGWIDDGSASPHTGTNFYFSSNAGTSFQTVSIANGYGSDVMEVFDFGFGKARAGASYPTIFIAGFVDGVWGIYMSWDQAQTWNRIDVNGYAGDNPDLVSVVFGDMDIYGRVYIGTGGGQGGTGFMRGDFPL